MARRSRRRERLAGYAHGWLTTRDPNPNTNPNTNTNASPTPGAPIGLIWYIPVGKGVKEEAYVGSVGNREWQERTQNTRYEFTVRMDNGNYQFAQKQGVSDLSVGERVKMSRGQIERWSQ